MNSGNMTGILIGWFLCGFLSIFYWINTDSYQKGQEVFKLIEECQKELKRTEHCIIVAVPKLEAPGSGDK